MDERFYTGIQDFNEEKFYEAHEVLEDLWHEYREDDRTFIQGLIQIAAAFYHLQCENYRGAISQLAKGKQKLERYSPAHHDIDVACLLSKVEEWMASVEKLQRDPSFRRAEEKFPKLLNKNSEPMNL